MEKPEFVVVMDFDGTLTPKKYKSLWTVLETPRYFPGPFRKKLEELRDRFLPKILAGQLVQEDAKQWLVETIKTYIQAKLTKVQMEDQIRHVKLRKGVVQCLDFLLEKNIPVAIISSGLYDLIDMLLRNHGERLSFMVKETFATRLVFDRYGRAVDFEPETIILPQQKGQASLKFAESCGVLKERILAIGDSGGDSALGYLRENRLGIAETEEEKAKISEFFGEVMVTQDFYPVIGWLKARIH